MRREEIFVDESKDYTLTREAIKFILEKTGQQVGEDLWNDIDTMWQSEYEDNAPESKERQTLIAYRSGENGEFDNKDMVQEYFGLDAD